MKKIILLCFCSLIYQTMFSQLVVNSAMTPEQLVQNVLAGSGITVSNITYNYIAGSFYDKSGSIGSFSGGASTNLGISNGIIMATGLVNDTGTNGNCPCLIGSPASNFNSWIMDTPGDSVLSTIASAPLDSCFDAAVLQFDFIPSLDTISIQYVFASEEYPMYVNSIYNDICGAFLSGANPVGGNYKNFNIATVPDTTLPICINTVNDGKNSSGPPLGPCTNCNHYVDNYYGQTIVYNGFTTVLSAKCTVIPYTTYHIRIAVEDVGDPTYDSAIFLEANSLTTGVKNYSLKNNIFLYPNPAVDNITVGCPPQAVINITNIQGQVIKTFTTSDNYSNINVSSLPSGVYIVQMKTEDRVAVKKFIKE